MKKAFCAMLVAMLAGCGGSKEQDLGPVRYMVEEYPLASGYAGSCLARKFETDYSFPGLRELKWSIGGDIDVNLTWPDCPHCSPVSADFVPLNDSWRIHSATTTPALIHFVPLRANEAGEGGFKTVVHGKELDPPFKLTVAAPSSIRFERARGSGFADIIPGAITEIHAVRGDDNIVVAATMRDAAGEHLCGAVPAVVTVSPVGLFTVEARLSEPSIGLELPYVNLPFRILPGNAPGVGTFELRAGGLRATLRVIVD